MDNLEYRMYGLVPYNISPIQQGIQFGHALQEYNNIIFDCMHNVGGDRNPYPTFTEETVGAFFGWRTKWKTFIILNGGTTNSNRELGTGVSIGSLNQHVDSLQEKGIPLATFHEPDLNDALTAVVFLVDERVFDKKKYPNIEDYMKDKVANDIITAMLDSEKIYKDWVELIGGETNVWLREFLSQFKFA